MAKKKLARQTTHTELDVSTGEFRRIMTDETIGYVDKEPDYIKIYIGTQLCLLDMDPGLAPYIIAFGPWMTYANNESYQHMVQTHELAREGVAKALGVGTKRVEQIIKKLVDAGIFIPIYRETEKDGVVKRTRKRGFYFVNPWVVAKGSWSDIKKLQQNIDFVQGVSSYVIDEGTGQRKVQCQLPAGYHQMTLDELQKQKGDDTNENKASADT